jgi:putative MATE family efflux protein
MPESSDALAAPGAPVPATNIRGRLAATWAIVRESMRGSRRDYTEGPIGQAIVLLAIPMVLEVALESVLAVVNVFWVGRLGADAIATVGLTESMLALVYAVAMGLSMGAAATVARRIGEKDPERAASAAVQSIALGIVVAVPIGIAGATLAPRLLMAMGAQPSVIATGARFTAIMLAANVVILLLFLINAIFRGAGDASIAMRSLWLANIVNLLLDPCFIFGLGPFPRLGVTGAAVATCIGRGSGVLFQVWTLSRGRGRIVIGRRHLSVDPAAMLRLLRVSANGIFQVAVGTASWIGLVRIVSSFGSAALAGYTIGIRIVIFAIFPSWGMSNAAATMVGQNLGAKKPDRAERAVWIAGFYNMIFLGTLGALFALFTRPLIGLFTADPQVLAYGADCLRFVSYGFPLYAFGMVFTQAFNGAGDTWTPTKINLFCFWFWEIPLAWVLAVRARMGPRGAFVAVMVAFSTLALVSGTLFRRGRWKEKKI